MPVVAIPAMPAAPDHPDHPDRPAGLLAAVRRRRLSHRVLFAATAVAGLLSLGLPWASAADGKYIPGWYVPGSCITVYDANGYPSMDCSAGMIGPGFFVAGHGAYGGLGTAARVFVVAVALVIWLALRKRSRPLAVTAVALAAAGLALGGLRPRAGQLVYLAGMVLLVLALRDARLLGVRTLRPEPLRRSPHAAGPG